MTTRSSPYRTTSCSTISVRAQSRTACWLWGLRRDITESTSPPFTTSQYESLLPLPLACCVFDVTTDVKFQAAILGPRPCLPLRHFSSFPQSPKASRPRTSCISFCHCHPPPPRPLIFVSVSPKRSIIFFSCISSPFKPPFRGQDQKHGIAPPPRYTRPSSPPSTEAATPRTCHTWH